MATLANLLFAKELARRLDGTGVSTYALHPGIVASDVLRTVPWPGRPLLSRLMLSTDEGAATSLYCATSSDVAGQSGLYYENAWSQKRPPLHVTRHSRQVSGALVRHGHRINERRTTRYERSTQP